MTARTPEELDQLFMERMAAGDVDGIVALYERGAVLVSPQGASTTGPAAIREALAGLAAMRPRMTMNITRIIRTDYDLALVYNDWQLSAVDVEAKPVAMSGRAIEVVRRQPDGTWLFVVDDPFARG